MCHTNAVVKACVSLTTSELLVVYRESLDAKAHSRKVARELVRGPCLYKPQTCGEWTHKFSWHGHDPSGGELARKRPNGLKFEKLQTAPASLYFDVENVRTSDDALLTVRLMIFYQLTDVEAMINATVSPPHERQRGRRPTARCQWPRAPMPHRAHPSPRACRTPCRRTTRSRRSSTR